MGDCGVRFGGRDPGSVDFQDDLTSQGKYGPLDHTDSLPTSQEGVFGDSKRVGVLYRRSKGVSLTSLSPPPSSSYDVTVNTGPESSVGGSKGDNQCV